MHWPTLSLLDQPTATDTDEYQTTSQRWHETDELQLTDVSYTYPEATEPALHHINLDFKGYERVALVGTSGSGKSTLLNLIGGFLNGAGGVSLNGQQLPHLQQRAWQEQIQVLPQQPYIFHDTLVATWHSMHQLNGRKIREAIETVGLSEWFEALPEGLDTLIGEGAMQTSGGQAQRIGLARIMLDDNRRVLLLDEPTAHLDIETEVRLKETMLPLFDKRLVVFATHRLHWLTEMDLIIVMRDGRIVEQGTLSELMANNGYFVELQAAMRGVTHA